MPIDDTPENNYILHKHKIEIDLIEKNKREKEELSKEVDSILNEVREKIEQPVSVNFLKYPNSWTSGYISRIDNLINKVREANNIDIAKSLLTASKYIFDDNSNIIVAKKIIKSIEMDHRIDESAYLIKSDIIFNYSLIACAFLIGLLSFILFAINFHNQKYSNNTLPFFYVILGAYSGLLGSVIGWSTRSPQAYDLSSGKRRFEVQWALISAMTYPIVPSILGAIVAISIITGVFPLKDNSHTIGYITIISFLIGYSDSYRASIINKLGKISIK